MPKEAGSEASDTRKSDVCVCVCDLLFKNQFVEEEEKMRIVIDV